MLLDWSDAAEAQLAGSVLRPGILLRVDSDEPLRLWAGSRNIAIGSDLIEDVDQAVYRGAGELVGIPQVKQLINGVADRADFVLSAVTAEMAALASEGAADIRDVPVHLGLLVFDAEWQVASPTAWLWEGVADSMTVTRDGQSRTLTLSVGSAMTGRRRPPNAFWTNPDQQRLHPTDRAFERVRKISQGTVKTWPE